VVIAFDHTVINITGLERTAVCVNYKTNRYI